MYYLMSFSLFFAMLSAKPPRNIPQEYFNEYTANGTIPVYDYYLDNTSEADGIKIYSKHEVEKLRFRAKKKQVNYYGITDTWLYDLVNRHPKLLKGKNIAIVGSTVPWYEAIVLSYGGHPETIEYNHIEMQDKRLKYVSVDQIKTNPKQYDVVISISSFEHDGLGRYGDPLNPNGDLETMKFWKTCIKDDGYMILSVPVGKDAIMWNAHRIYGRYRFPKLVEGYEIIDTAPSLDQIESFFDLNPHSELQPVFLLKKKL